MPTRNINLTAQQSAFVDRVVRSGRYQNASEAVRDALRVLEQQHQEHAFRLQALRDQIRAGTDALDRGEFIAVAEADLDAFLDAPEGRSARPRRARARS